MENYGASNIKVLKGLEAVRKRPGMYIGRLGNGTHAEDGIYVLIKETIDNCIDEFTMGAGKKIEVVLNERTVSIRDYGRGIPLGKLIDCVFLAACGVTLLRACDRRHWGTIGNISGKHQAGEFVAAAVWEFPWFDIQYSRYS